MSMDEFTYHVGEKKWLLPLVVAIDDGVVSRHYFYQIIEYRRPKKGEYFLDGAVITAYKAVTDLYDEYLVVELTCPAKLIWVWEKDK